MWNDHQSSTLVLKNVTICHCPKALYFDSSCLKTAVGVSQGYRHLSNNPFNTLVNHSVGKIPLPSTFPTFCLTLQWLVVCRRTTRPSQHSTNVTCTWEPNTQPQRGWVCHNDPLSGHYLPPAYQRRPSCDTKGEGIYYKLEYKLLPKNSFKEKDYESVAHGLHCKTI